MVQPGLRGAAVVAITPLRRGWVGGGGREEEEEEEEDCFCCWRE